MDFLANNSAAIVEWWWRYVFHATWTSSLIALIVLIVLRLGRRWSAHLRFALLLIVLVKFAVPPMLTLPTGLFSRWGPAVSWQNTAAKERMSPASLEVSAPRESDGAPPVWAFRIKTCLMGIHLLGCIVIAVSIVVQWFRLTGIIRHGRIITDGPLHARLQKTIARLGIRRRVKLVFSSRQLPPMAFGVLSPTILLPASAVRRLSSRELEAVFAHELIHHRRGDLWINWLVAALGALWWFNPVLWGVNRRVREACENCCDDHLLARGITTGKNYCKALLNIATILPKTWQLNAAFGFAERLHPLAARMERILDSRARKLPRLPWAGMGLMVVLAVLILPGLPSAKSDQTQLEPMAAMETPAATNMAETGETETLPEYQTESAHPVISRSDDISKTTKSLPYVSTSPIATSGIPQRSSMPRFTPKPSVASQVMTSPKRRPGNYVHPSTAAGNARFTLPPIATQSYSAPNPSARTTHLWNSRRSSHNLEHYSVPPSQPRTRILTGGTNLLPVQTPKTRSILEIVDAEVASRFDENFPKRQNSRIYDPVAMLPTLRPPTIDPPLLPEEPEAKIVVSPIPSPKNSPPMFILPPQPEEPPLDDIHLIVDFNDINAPQCNSVTHQDYNIHIQTGELNLIENNNNINLSPTIALLPSSSLRFNVQIPQNSTAVPEPATILSLTLGALLLTPRRRRR
ncbi:MAG: PEP-CTERM sorting domain-containing protein [Phycisphaerae bacterium]|nr:PEP-CTERM sorting domain-containing protein [Phycisphaerae bacterium]